MTKAKKNTSGKPDRRFRLRYLHWVSAATSAIEFIFFSGPTAVFARYI